MQAKRGPRPELETNLARFGSAQTSSQLHGTQPHGLQKLCNLCFHIVVRNLHAAWAGVSPEASLHCSAALHCCPQAPSSSRSIGMQPRRDAKCSAVCTHSEPHVSKSKSKS